MTSRPKIFHRCLQYKLREQILWPSHSQNERCSNGRLKENCRRLSSTLKKFHLKLSRPRSNQARSEDCQWICQPPKVCWVDKAGKVPSLSLLATLKLLSLSKTIQLLKIRRKEPLSWRSKGSLEFRCGTCFPFPWQLFSPCFQPHRHSSSPSRCFTKVVTTRQIYRPTRSTLRLPWLAVFVVFHFCSWVGFFSIWWVGSRQLRFFSPWWESAP